MRIKTLLLAVVLIPLGLLIRNIEVADRDLQIKNIELKSNQAELKMLEQQYDELLESDKIKQEQLDKVNQEKDQLKKELQAKKEAEAEAIRIAGATQPAPKPNTAPVSSGGCELVYNYSNWDQSVAHAVCLAESGGNSNAANYNDNHGQCVGSFGLMQLACFWIPNPTDPVANMAKANEIYSQSGWQPWGAYTSGAYLRYL